MGTVAHYVEVNATPDKVYGWWRGLTNLPSIFPDVKTIQVRGSDDTITHWVVSGPLGKAIEWDAKIVEDVANARLAWRSVDGAVDNSGAVRFDDHGQTTGVEVSLQYDPPAGVVGDAIAKLFSDPQDKVERALASFKETIESQTPGSSAATTTT